MVILSGARCRLAYAQLMPPPLTVSCFSKIQIGFTFLVPAHPGSPGKRAVKRVCVCCVAASHAQNAKMWPIVMGVPCLCIGHNHELCQNGWNYQNGVWYVDPKNHI